MSKITENGLHEVFSAKRKLYSPHLFIMTILQTL